jgi:hypothetical protein
MTQTERVLSMLRVAGKRGIRSDEFFHCGMPRGAARIRDLKDEGVQIESVREGKFVRYTLANAGADTGSSSEKVLATGPSLSSGPSVDSGVEPTELPAPPPVQSAPPERSVPSCFDFDVDWAA